MSLTTCNSCEAFIATDEDPDSYVDIHFICESCREGEVVDGYEHETDKYKDNLINQLRAENQLMRENKTANQWLSQVHLRNIENACLVKQNESYKQALENIAYAKSWTVQNKPYELVSMALLALGKL